LSLRQILADAAKGVFPPPDGGVTVVAQPSPRDAGVLNLTAHAVVFADADPEWIRALLPPGDFSAPLNPPFLTALCERLGRQVNNIDLLALAPALPGPPPSALGHAQGPPQEPPTPGSRGHCTTATTYGPGPCPAAPC
jgi:hypothetical protein